MKLTLALRNSVACGAFLAAAINCDATTAATKTWIEPIGSFWSSNDNWSPNGAPQPGDDVRIGHSPLVVDSTVYVDEDVNIASLELVDGMTIFTEGYEFLVQDDVLVFGHNGVQPSHLLIERGANVRDFDTDLLTVTDGGFVTLQDGAILEVDERLTIFADSYLRGTGVVNLLRNGDRAMVLDGIINPRYQGMVINQVGTGLIDLDGDAGNSRIALRLFDGVNAQSLTINGTALFDSFGGTMEIGGGGFLEMNLDTGWASSAGSSIELFGALDAGNTNVAELRGSELTLLGQLAAVEDADARVMAPVTFAPGSEISAASNTLLRFYGAATIEGGEFQVAQDGNIRFLGATTIAGGNFTTSSKLGSDGSVRFDGPTTWDGTVAVDGIALQFGDATVSGATVIDADVLDMDGGGNTTWNIHQSAVINTESVDSTIINTFDGTMNVEGGFAAKLTINLDGAFDEWTMAGEMKLAGQNLAAFPIERVAGSPLRVTGELNVEYRVRIAADTTFAASSATSFENDSDQLQLSGKTLVAAGADFAGGGLLANGPSGEMTLADGASLGGTSLTNRGLLQVGNSPGTATVEEFVNQSDGTWLVEIGGHLPGTEHDRLLPGSGAELGGQLEVDLIDAGGGLFLPSIGDTFTILTSPGGVSGSFLNDPVSSAAGQQFHWSVIYNPNDVLLQLVAITVPEPTTLVVAAIAALAIAGRRVRR